MVQARAASRLRGVWAFEQGENREACFRLPDIYTQADCDPRKYLLCALARNDIDGARSIYHSMAEETQKEPRTLYLMYKIAIRSDDREAATTCIEGISRVPEPLEYLYACCLDAQEARHKEYAIEALSRLLEKTTPSASCPVHLPALLRCTIRLMVKNLDGQEDETARNEAIQKLCAVFDEGMSNGWLSLLISSVFAAVF